MPHRVVLIEQAFIPEESSLCGLLTPKYGFECQRSTWGTLQLAPQHLRDARLVVAVGAPDENQALSLFRWLREHPFPVPTLAVLPDPPSDEIFRAASDIASDFIVAPIRAFELHCRLREIVGPEGDDPTSVRDRLREQLGLGQLVGDAPSFRRAVHRIPLIASSEAPALLVGETGTGKEICARAIHSLGPRSDFPFIPVDCGALPEHLVENELFGHARGAFTDAHADQRGLVGMAEGGTLFLDEIDALSLGTQAKLLRFLQDGTYRTLGAERFSRANVRVLAATNVRLETCMAEKRFRSDLYFRLNVLRLELPPLRERRGDIGLLACDFLEQFCRARGSRQRTFSAAALQLLEQHDWPGNIRELRNVVERAVVLSPGSKVLPAHLPLSNSHNSDETLIPSFRKAREVAIEAFERRYVEHALRRHGGNVTRAAEEAGKDRRDFGRLVKKYGIDRHNL